MDWRTGNPPNGTAAARSALVSRRRRDGEAPSHANWTKNAHWFLVPMSIARRLYSRLHRKGARWLLASGKALAPFVRVARGMKYGVDRDRRLRLPVEHGLPSYQM